MIAMAQDVESVTLKQAVDRALRNSREVAVAQMQYNVARNTIDVNRAAFKPNLYTRFRCGLHVWISANAWRRRTLDHQFVLRADVVQSHDERAGSRRE